MVTDNLRKAFIYSSLYYFLLYTMPVGLPNCKHWKENEGERRWQAAENDGSLINRTYFIPRIQYDTDALACKVYHHHRHRNQIKISVNNRQIICRNNSAKRDSQTGRDWARLQAQQQTINQRPTSSNDDDDANSALMTFHLHSKLWNDQAKEA